MSVTKDDILHGLRSLGVRPGDSFVMHSSLSSLGRVDGGPDAVIDAALESVAPGGTVLMPVMTFEGAFDVRHTSSKTGLVTETFRRRPNAIRSLNATHSIAGIGPDAQRLLDGHRDDLPFGPNGPGAPLGKLADMGGSIILLGVTHVSNTTIHIVHYLAGLPMREEWREIEVTDAGGRKKTVRVRHPGCSDGFDKLEPYFIEKGIQRTGHIGNAEVRIMKGRECIEAGLDAVGRDPTLVLCDRDDCRFCTYAKERL